MVVEGVATPPCVAVWLIIVVGFINCLLLWVRGLAVGLLGRVVSLRRLRSLRRLVRLVRLSSLVSLRSLGSLRSLRLYLANFPKFLKFPNFLNFPNFPIFPILLLLSNTAPCCTFPSLVSLYSGCKYTIIEYPLSSVLTNIFSILFRKRLRPHFLSEWCICGAITRSHTVTESHSHRGWGVCELCDFFN